MGKSLTIPLYLFTYIKKPKGVMCVLTYIFNRELSLVKTVLKPFVFATGLWATAAAAASADDDKGPGNIIDNTASSSSFSIEPGAFDLAMATNNFTGAHPDAFSLNGDDVTEESFQATTIVPKRVAKSERPMARPQLWTSSRPFLRPKAPETNIVDAEEVETPPPENALGTVRPEPRPAGFQNQKPNPVLDKKGRVLIAKRTLTRTEATQGPQAQSLIADSTQPGLDSNTAHISVSRGTQPTYNIQAAQLSVPQAPAKEVAAMVVEAPQATPAPKILDLTPILTAPLDLKPYIVADKKAKPKRLVLSKDDRVPYDRPLWAQGAKTAPIKTASSPTLRSEGLEPLLVLTEQMQVVEEPAGPLKLTKNQMVIPPNDQTLAHNVPQVEPITSVKQTRVAASFSPSCLGLEAMMGNANCQNGGSFAGGGGVTPSPLAKEIAAKHRRDERERRAQRAPAAGPEGCRQSPHSGHRKQREQEDQQAIIFRWQITGLLLHKYLHLSIQI